MALRMAFYSWEAIIWEALIDEFEIVWTSFASIS